MIPQADPKQRLFEARDEILQAMARVLDRGAFILGEELAAFEAEFATYVGARHAVGVSSGT